MTDQRYVYIAGPYTAADYLAIDRNIAVAQAWAARLAEARIPFYCPHLATAHFEVILPHMPADWWLEMHMIFLEHAAAMLLLPGWEDSSGTEVERARAHELRLPFFVAAHQFHKLLAWWAR